LTLVVLHLILIVIWAKELENHLVFSLDHQKTVSLLITAITTTFGTVCTVPLRHLTQVTCSAASFIPQSWFL
jgi:hypothetical protein